METVCDILDNKKVNLTNCWYSDLGINNIGSNKKNEKIKTKLKIITLKKYNILKAQIEWLTWSDWKRRDISLSIL